MGACSAAVAADSGHRVLVYDVDEAKVAALSSSTKADIEGCLYEEGLADLLIRHKESIDFSTDYTKVVDFLDTCDAVFLCLPTPEVGETGESNLSYYRDATTMLAAAMAKRNGGEQSKYIVLVNKSTVPIDTIDITHTLMKAAGVMNYGVVSNPEFLVEGKAIEGSIRPDRVVVGVENDVDRDVMRSLYQRFYDSSTVSYIEVNPREAAAGKLLANYYLFTKIITCFDVIGRVCETFDGLSFEQVRQVVQSDARIGNWGFYDSLYAGGSCLIKDARSLSHQLTQAGETPSLVDEMYAGNKRQLSSFLARPEKDLGFDWKGKRVALLGLSFKQGTNDVRNSPAFDIVHTLLEKGASQFVCYDPVAVPQFAHHFPASDTYRYADTAQEAIADADVVVLVTDWPAFRLLDEMIIDTPLDLFMDGRRLLHHRYDAIVASGTAVVAVGSMSVKV